MYTRFIPKLQEKIDELDKLHEEINNEYSIGAVEGYSAENLGLV